MKFEITGDNQAILKALEAYNEAFNQEYKVQIHAAKEKLAVLGMEKSVNALPDEFTMFFWEENGKIIIRIPVYTPRIIKITGTHKKLGKNFKGFLESQGIYIKEVKYLGD
jgi:hypothetical protein